ncbi:MAG: sugar ABC transporter permease [Spirochaetia bacterium]|nr:sugar ABC transporter permease [Spirochaetia bacterium]
MRRRKLCWHGPLTPWLFLLPTVIGLLVFRAIPVGAAFYLGFTRWSLLNNPVFIGLRNYKEAFASATFFKVVTNTVVFSLIYVVGVMVVSLAFALLINRKLKGINFFRAALYLPVITSAVAVGIVWNWILGPQYGILNIILTKLGITPPYWLGDPRLALLSVSVVQVWKMAGYYMILFLAGLQNMPHEVLEAATVDGAKPFQKFFHVTLPLLSPTTFFVLTVAIIDSFHNFELIYTMTKGGPQNATDTLVYDVYLNGFVNYRNGYASAVAFVLLIFVGVLTLMNFYIKKKWVTQG